MAISEGLMTIGEAARELRISPETLRLWADDGKVHAQRTSSGLRIFRRADIARVQQKRRAAHGGEAA
jgi:excisionase family DNA binding protein